MSQIIDMRLASGDPVYVESRESEGPRPAGSLTGEVVKRAGKSFEAALETVKPAAAAVIKAFQELNQPDEITLELGIDFKGKVDSFVVTGEAGAAFKLSLTWKRSGDRSG